MKFVGGCDTVLVNIIRKYNRAVLLLVRYMTYNVSSLKLLPQLFSQYLCEHIRRNSYISRTFRIYNC